MKIVTTVFERLNRSFGTQFAASLASFFGQEGRGLNHRQALGRVTTLFLYHAYVCTLKKKRPFLPVWGRDCNLE
jgi:hypothetical protein